MVEFPGGIRGMALNLEADNVGVVIFGSDRSIKEGDISQADWCHPWTFRLVQSFWVALLTRSAHPIDGKGPINATRRSRVDVKAPGIIPRKSVHEPMSTAPESH